MDASLSTTLLHAITFLLSPLAPHFQPQTLDALHLALLSALSASQSSAEYSQNLILSRHAPPPTPIQFALNALSSLPPSYRVSWQDWLILLSGGNQVILSIVPGFVQAAVRNPLTKDLVFTIIWDASVQRRTPSPWGSSSRSRSSAHSSSGSGSESSRSSSPAIELQMPHSPAVAVSAAENVLRGYEDDGDDLVLLNKQSRSPANAWPPHPMSTTTFKPKSSPFAIGASRPRAEYQQHSRSSSRSSTVSSCAPSLVSATTSASSAANLANSLSALSLSSRNHARTNSSSLSLTLSNASTLSSSPEPPSPTPSMDDEDITCYIDSSKTQTAVTEYECGKVGVLTGAVMLGVPSSGKAKVIPSGVKSTKPSPIQPPRNGAQQQGFKPNTWRRNSAIRI